MKEIFEKSLSNFSLDEFAKNLVDFSILKAFANFSQDTDITNEEPQLVNNNQSEYFDESLTCERNTHLVIFIFYFHATWMCVDLQYSQLL